eukprot:gene17575-36108_t
MKLNLTIFTLFVIGASIFSAEASVHKPEVRIVMLSQQSGPGVAASVTIEFPLLVKQWNKHLNEKLATDPSWPFNATIEVYDTKSNPVYTAKLLKNRYSNSSLPPITVLYGPETTALMAPVALFSHAHNIPWVSSQYVHSIPRSPIYNASFSVLPPNFYQNIELINSYIDQGVETIATVSNTYYAYNTLTCPPTASYAETRGIKVVVQFSITPATPRSDIVEIIRQLRDQYKPDAIIWCDLYSALAAFSDQFNPITMFKELNYLPKALSLQDGLDSSDQISLKKQGLYLYVTT